MEERQESLMHQEQILCMEEIILGQLHLLIQLQSLIIGLLKMVSQIPSQ